MDCTERLLQPSRHGLPTWLSVICLATVVWVAAYAHLTEFAATVLAFMMSVIALSLPETIILRKVLRPRLIATLVGVVAVGIPNPDGGLCVQCAAVNPRRFELMRSYL